MTAETKSMRGSGRSIMVAISQFLDDHRIDDLFERSTLSSQIYYEITGNDLGPTDVPRDPQKLLDLMIDWAHILHDRGIAGHDGRKPFLCAIDASLRHFRIPFNNDRRRIYSRICSEFGMRSGSRRRKNASERYAESIQPSLPFTTPSAPR
jgi:hypothetical protein